MTKISLPPEKIGKLKREASERTYAFRQLCREAIVRSWLTKHGIPSWRNPVSPPGEYRTTTSRYGIMLADGSRFMVCRAEDTAVSFDAVAEAKCFDVLGISLSDDCRSGEPEGYVLLRDMEPGVSRYDFATNDQRTPSSFIPRIRTAGGYLSVLLRFSLRLLILGEPDAPVRGTENVRAFQPAKRRET